ncbi:T9SS type A sorting domain-containing protein [candidate division KSB1 bacterium]|nr:T9SS type A sorting domain-containing protein [candidate division KSB1 bacterium]
MFRNSCISLLALLVIASTSEAARPAKDRVVGPVFMTGLEETSFSADDPGYRPGHPTLDDTMRIGTTWYDLQSNGTMGKQVSVGGGYVHFVWTNGLNLGSSIRHVYYNAWDIEAQQFSSAVGAQVDASTRAGFGVSTTNVEGFCFPAFHQAFGGNPYTAVAIDYLPGSGAFTTLEVPHLTGDPQIIWPKIDVDVEGNLHIVSTESGGSSLDYYVKGVPEIVGGEGLTIDFPDPWLEWDAATFITMDVACGRHSPRVAVAWLNENGGGEATDPTNAYLRISEDAGLTWGDIIEITEIQPLDTDCVEFGGDPNVCNGDTMHPWIDLSVIMDDNDSVHVAFSANGYFYWDTDGTVFDGGLVYSTLWHWYEGRDELNIIHDAWYAHRDVALGANNLMVHRPNLAVDTTNGFLYCSFQKFDSLQVSHDLGFPSGDAYITVSTTGGRTWSAALNVSNTVTDSGAPAGECLSERDISIADIVTDGTVHMQYMLDLDCGTSVLSTGEGDPTLNPEFYVPIPVTDIPLRPLVNPYRNFHADSSGYPWDLDTLDISAEQRRESPRNFALYQNYPNPFNPSTQIQFDLATAGSVELTVFDLTGREVVQLLQAERLAAGAHVVEFNASDLSSGVYFYRLTVKDLSQTRKMMLIR